MSSVSISNSRWPGSLFLFYTMSNVSFSYILQWPTSSHDAQCLPSYMTRVSIPIFYDMKCFHSYDQDLHSSMTWKPVFSFLYVYNELIIFYDVKCVHSYFFSFYDIQCHYTSFLNEQYLLFSCSGRLVSPFVYFLITNVFTSLSHDAYCLHFSISRWSAYQLKSVARRCQCLNFHITFPVSSFLYYHDDHCLYSCISRCPISQFLYLKLNRVSVSL